MQPSQPEHSVVRTYLEWILDLPWFVKDDENEGALPFPLFFPFASLSSIPFLVCGLPLDRNLVPLPPPSSLGRVLHPQRVTPTHESRRTWKKRFSM